MPIYQCNTKACSLHGEQAFIESTKIVIRGYQVVDVEAPCPACGEERETIKEDGYTTKIHGGKGNIPIK